MPFKDDDLQRMRQSFEALVTERKSMEQTWDNIERFIMPLRGGKFFEDDRTEQSQEWQRREIFDDTAITDADILSASIHGSLTSPAIKWFDLKFGSKDLRQDPESAAWLQACTDIIYQELQESNFDMEVQEGYLDLVGFGNTCVTLEMEGTYDNFAGFDFNCIPVRGIYFDESSKGQVYNLYRRLEWTLNQIVDKFGLEDIPEHLSELYKDGKAETDHKYNIIFCIYTRAKVDKDVDLVAPLPEDLRPFGYTYILRNTAERLGKPGGYYEMPAYLPRWRKTSGSKYGYGPGHLAISSVMTLNEYYRLDLKSAEKAIDPASIATERGLISDLDLGPRGLTIVKDINTSLKPYESGARFDISDTRMEQLRNQIHRVFKIDQLNLKDSPAMSATEAQIRYELMNRVIGPTLGRLKTDFFNPMIQRAFNILFRADKFPEMPDKVKSETEGKLDVHYTGPMERAQKMDQVASIERWLAFIGQFGEAYPDMVDVPNEVKIAKEMADILDINMENVHSNAELSTIKRLKQQLAEVQQQLMQAQAEGEAMQAQGKGMQEMEQV
jgi:Bacteriophage head to tail connecting protein